MTETVCRLPMQRSGSLGHLAMALTIATSLIVLFPPAARGQDDPFASDAVLVQGNPPLTESMVARFTNFQAWLLEIPFTQPQKERVRAMLLRDWKKPEGIEQNMTWLTLAAAIAPLTPDDREFARCDIQPGVLKNLREDKDSPDARWLVAAYDEAHPPIAAGSPPLTESMVSRYIAFVGWLLEIPLSQALKDRQRAMLIEDWQKPKDLESDTAMLNWQVDMARLKNKTAEREYVRSVAQPDVIKKMRADKSNPDAQLLVSTYDATHPSIAAGNPPLTRQAVDAWTELIYFVRNQSGAPHMDVTQAVKDDLAHAIAETYPKHSAEQQKAFSEMPQEWAAMRLAWLTGKDADRQKILAAWQPVVNASPPADAQQAAASEAMARAYAFEKRDEKTVSNQELLQAAKDADLVALAQRREGQPKNLASAADWEELARTMRAGKEAYLKRQAAIRQGQADIVEEYLKTQVILGALNRVIARPR